MGVWIDYEGNETLTDPDAGEIIHDDRTVRDFAEITLRSLEPGEPLEELTARTALDMYLISATLNIARRNRTQDPT